jgi:hypothetical protein
VMPDPNHPVDHFDVSRLDPVNESLNTICQLPPTPAGTNDPEDPPEPDDPEAPVDPVAPDGPVDPLEPDAPRVTPRPAGRGTAAIR